MLLYFFIIYYMGNRAWECENTDEKSFQRTDRPLASQTLIYRKGHQSKTLMGITLLLDIVSHTICSFFSHTGHIIDAARCLHTLSPIFRVSFCRPNLKWGSSGSCVYLSVPIYFIHTYSHHILYIYIQYWVYIYMVPKGWS